MSHSHKRTVKDHAINYDESPPVLRKLSSNRLAVKNVGSRSASSRLVRPAHAVGTARLCGRRSRKLRREVLARLFPSYPRRWSVPERGRVCRLLSNENSAALPEQVAGKQGPVRRSGERVPSTRPERDRA